ncbi:hypothetical protein CRG98_001313 [Punica granatum]|uniref:Enoyl-CoA hydratase 1, peroxisomal n=2 Tax=Punica granatum TaxID=22663 RepID=A0A2I0LC49_PUNGR|nr:hypothetical protein CRG98_001313 [Punica granatum]
MDTSGSLILVAREPGGITTVTINRPKALNSLIRPMMVDLARAIKALSRDDSDVFKGDLKDIETDPVAQMELCPKPIIGAINGFAFTAGFEIALACDILIAVNGAKFIDVHAKFGIFPSWGLSQKLSRIIGPSRALNHLVEERDLMKKAREVAEAIIRNNQDMVLRYKSVINDGLKLDLGHTLALEKERGHEYYNGITKEHFKKMQEFKAGLSSKKPASKM